MISISEVLYCLNYASSLAFSFVCVLYPSVAHAYFINDPFTVEEAWK
jgi:hypothetical protein